MLCARRPGRLASRLRGEPGIEAGGEPMSSTNDGRRVLEDVEVPVRLKLSAGWVVLLLLYAYGDIFGYFRPGFIEDVMAGEVFAFEIDQVFLVAISVYVALPALMVLLSLVLTPTVSRWANVVLGSVYAVTILLSTIGDDYVYYYVLSILEIVVALLIVWSAWTWPERAPAAPDAAR
jgi:hypothetical protein